jgi:hypothetical protein
LDVRYVASGLLLDSLGIGAFAPALLGLLVPTLVVIALSRQHGFPRARP